MSTYVMSDIHGHKKEFDEMLEKICFSDADELWILGDIIDKGQESGEMLRWAVDEAPSNVHFLLGNHEDMAYSTLMHSNGRQYIMVDDPWARNDGFATLYLLNCTFDEYIDGEKTTEWINDKLLPWIEELPTYHYLEVSGRAFMLVHAGFDPNMYDDVPDEDKFPDLCEGNFDVFARRVVENIGHGFGFQHSQNLLWERQTWHVSDKPAPIETIFGHSYFKEERIERYKKYYDMDIVGGMGKIAHFLNKHAIDCGCAYAADHPNKNKLGYYNLGCLRLDDMEEFYVQVREDDKRVEDLW